MSVGYGSRRVSAAMPSLRVDEAMSRREFYPGEPTVELRETHSAWVFLAAAALVVDGIVGPAT